MIAEFLLDENLSAKLCSSLATLGHASHVSHHLLLHADDASIWQFSKEKNYVIVTKDNDYFHKSRLLGCPPKVIKISCGNRPTTFLAELLVASSDSINSFVQSDKCYLEIVQ